MTTRRPRRRPGENRRRLVEAGLVEFGLFGYHGASTAGIARRAEVPQPHVYASFRTKQELFTSCAEQFLGDPAELAADEQDARTTMLLYQVVSVLSDPEMGEALLDIVQRCRDRLGLREFDRALLRGSEQLLRAARHR